ncbi:MAG TPA: MFS transporter [Polyangiaceae bacterium]|jgi:MFS family permease|nr:MFS transporter [Polyangiaceae bacterium]
MNEATEKRAAPATSLRAYMLIVAAGAFATTFAQQRVALGQYPILFHLKNNLHFNRQQVSTFFLWATFAWNLKPLAGVLTDAFPIRGSRRRVYMVLGGALGGGSWALLNFVRFDYALFLTVSITLNVGLVFASTAMGGLQVEAGQMYGVSGRVSSLRQVVMSLSQIGGPLVGGYLAERWFGYTAGAGAFVMLMLAVFAIAVFREPHLPPPPRVAEEDLTRPRYRPSAAIIAGILAIAAAGTTGLLVPGMLTIGYSLFALLVVFLVVLGLAMARVRNAVLFQAQGQLSLILSSKTLWLAVGMLFLVYIVPGLNTALTFRQSDELHFSDHFIGTLSSIEGGAGVVCAIVYALICRRFNLRALLVASIGLNALATLLYLIYDAHTAVPIHALVGGLGVMAELSLMDLAVRSTPRGCEALGFALMMSIRNFGIGVSDVVGSKLIDQFHFKFATLVFINAGTTALVLAFVPMLQRSLVMRKEGEIA